MPHISQQTSILSYTTDIAAAYFSQNNLPKSEIPGVIEQIHQTLMNIHLQKTSRGDRPNPAVPIKKSVMPDYIVCLEDGKKLKMLKRYLKTTYNMTPDEYRERWDLAKDYPMVAPNYAAKRSELAKNIGLGKKKNG